jgi:hypothetical protein
MQEENGCICVFLVVYFFTFPVLAQAFVFNFFSLQHAPPLQSFAPFPKPAALSGASPRALSAAAALAAAAALVAALVL